MKSYKRDNEIINECINVERKLSKFFFKTNFNLRKEIIDKILKKIDNYRIYKKKINNVNFYFNLSSYIARSAILNYNTNAKYFFEPQTTKLLTLINKNLGNTLIGGAFIGDHACLLAKQNSKNTIFAFEPDKINFKFLKLNKQKNNLNNLNISNKCLYKNDTTYLKIEIPLNKDSAYINTEKKLLKKKSNTISIDSFVKKNNIHNIRTIFIDVEGNEINILKGAMKILTTSCENIIFEVHSQYLNFKDGLINLDIIKLLEKLNFNLYAIRDDHDNVGKYNKIELINLRKVYYEGPPHGFNIFATKNKKILKHKDIIILNRKLSPKYLLYKKSSLFHPVGT